MLKNKIEALLFSSGKRMSVDEIAKLCNSNIDDVKEALQQLKWDYEEKKSSLMIIEEGNYWKITVKEEHLPLVKSIVTETELTKTLMETLAVIAFKYRIKQSNLIKIRTNKAYEHLMELEEMGYITRQKYGRTKLIRLSQKFFDYFSLPEEKLKEQFKDFEGIAKAIESKEDEIKKIKEDQKKMAEEAKKEKEKREKLGGLDIFEESPEEIEEEEAKEVEVVKEKLDGLEVVDEPEVEKEESTEENGEPIISEEEQTEESEPEEPEVEKKVKEILQPEEEETSPEVEKRVREIFNPPKEEGDEEEIEARRLKKKQKEEKEGEQKEEGSEDLLEASMKDGNNNNNNQE